MILSAHLAGHSGGLEERGSPGPLGHDGGGRQSYRHFPTSIEGSVEIIRVVINILPHLR